MIGGNELPPAERGRNGVGDGEIKNRGYPLGKNLATFSSK